MTSEERRAALIEAGLACMARGGIQEFTVDKICAEAGVSRGLISHHFGSMNALLAAVYATMYDGSTRLTRDPAPGETRLSALLDAFFAPEVFNREAFNIWLTLWGQISLNPDLGAEHRVQYARYVGDVAEAIREVARTRGRNTDANALARSFVCLVDGLGIQHCIEPASMPAKDAKAACRLFLEPHLGDF
ncbi:TetR/AcrR family transcriptional regulator [Albidovulum salinarum]|nr:TetR family transcriptional regulator C-terminal domain-containing protein [Defluviimonas sp. WL0024]